jgi:hypothetical protein
MARKPDAAYMRAQSRLVKDAAEKYTRPDWGREDPIARAAYDRLLESTGTPVRKGGRR